MRLMIRSFLVPLIFAALFCASQNLQADVVWNETVNGDLSSNSATPTALSFLNGNNTVIGSLSEPTGDLRDYMTFTIGPNQSMTGLILDSYVAATAGFQGINTGNTSFIPDTSTAGSFLGLEFVLAGFAGTDMLPLLAVGSYGSTGFTIPLGPGTYSYVIQEVTGGQSASYQLSFVVVPEPSSAGLCGLAGLLGGTRRRRV